MPGIGKSIDTDSVLVVAGAGGGEERWGTKCYGLLGAENILDLDRGDGCTTL